MSLKEALAYLTNLKDVTRMKHLNIFVNSKGVTKEVSK